MNSNLQCRLIVLLSGLAIAQATASLLASEVLKRLSAPEIRAKIIGSVVTDESHWSDRFESNGILTAMELGQLKPGTWKLKGNEICLTRKARKPVEECFEIWLSQDQIEYRRDGIALTTGVLRKE